MSLLPAVSKAPAVPLVSTIKLSPLVTVSQITFAMYPLPVITEHKSPDAASTNATPAIGKVPSVASATLPLESISNTSPAEIAAEKRKKEIKAAKNNKSTNKISPSVPVEKKKKKTGFNPERSKSDF